MSGPLPDSKPEPIVLDSPVLVAYERMKTRTNAPNGTTLTTSPSTTPSTPCADANAAHAAGSCSCEGRDTAR